MNFLRSGKVGGQQFALRPQDFFSATQNHLILSAPVSVSLHPLFPDAEQSPLEELLNRKAPQTALTT